MTSRQGRQSYFRYNNLNMLVMRDNEGNVAGHHVGLRTKWYPVFDEPLPKLL